jgi:hypothetical protein
MPPDLGALCRHQNCRDEVIRCCVCLCVCVCVCARAELFLYLQRRLGESIELDETVESSNDEVMRLRGKPDLGIWN